MIPLQTGKYRSVSNISSSLFCQLCHYLINEFAIRFAFQLAHDSFHDLTFVLGSQNICEFILKDRCDLFFGQHFRCKFAHDLITFLILF